MFLHLGENVAVRKRDIIAILDIKSTLNSKDSRKFLEMCEEEGFVVKVANDKLCSLIVAGTVKNGTVYGIKVYGSPISALTLQKRAHFIK